MHSSRLNTPLNLGFELGLGFSYRDVPRLDHSDLLKLSSYLRSSIVEFCSKSGGHLSSNLGVVELTVSLLRFFTPDKDSIIFDVGHQCYAYKMLTLRHDKLHTMRSYNGLSGYQSRSESPLDHYGAGHSSTSISAAMGIATAKHFSDDTSSTIAIIGDGALTAGMPFEALNNISTIPGKVIVIVNDNQMSISKTVGSLSSHMAMVAQSSTVESIFTTMGLQYMGSVDGHDMPEMQTALLACKESDRSCVLHVRTIKGKGLDVSEASPADYHGVSPAKPIATTKPIATATTSSSTYIPPASRVYSSVVGSKLVAMADDHDDIVALTAAMPTGTGLDVFANAHPDRFYDVGIAEQHQIVFAAGLASAGLRPYVGIYSTFLQRGYDALVHDVVIQNLPVVFCIDRAGLVGEDGATHHGLFDIAFMRCLPNMTIMLPRDPQELEAMLDLSYSLSSPCSIRYPRGGGSTYPDMPIAPIVLGEAEIIDECEAASVVLISVGHIFDECHKAYTDLMSAGIHVAFINLRFVKPLDIAKLCEHLRDRKHIVCVEDGCQVGGAGEMLQAALPQYGIASPVTHLAVQDTLIKHGSVAQLRAQCSIDAKSIYRTVCSIVQNPSIDCVPYPIAVEPNPTITEDR